MERGEAEGGLDNKVVVTSLSPNSIKSGEPANSRVGAGSKSGIAQDAVMSPGIVGSWLGGIITSRDEVESLL